MSSNRNIRDFPTIDSQAIKTAVQDFFCDERFIDELCEKISQIMKVHVQEVIDKYEEEMGELKETISKLEWRIDTIDREQKTYKGFQRKTSVDDTKYEIDSYKDDRKNVGLETSKCHTCDMFIEGRSITALGKTYHPDHFVCGKCKKPITESPFHQRDGEPLCKEDFAATCPKCAACNLPITDKVISAMGSQWHEGHFVCNMCSSTLVGQEFHEIEGKPVCQGCYRTKVAAKCKGCGEPIETSVTIALDAKWHPDCFKCKSCGKAIASKTFQVDGKGFPLCGAC